MFCLEMIPLIKFRMTSSKTFKIEKKGVAQFLNERLIFKTIFTHLSLKTYKEISYKSSN